MVVGLKLSSASRLPPIATNGLTKHKGGVVNEKESRVLFREEVEKEVRRRLGIEKKEAGIKKMKGLAAKLEREKIQNRLRNENAKMRVEKWLIGEYKIQPTTAPIKEAETVAQYLARGGAVKVLKEMTKGKQKQMMYLRKKRRGKGRMK